MCRTKPRTSAFSTTSARKPRTRPPPGEISSAALRTASASREQMATLAPCPARARAMTLPMPLLPPVTRDTRSCSQLMGPFSAPLPASHAPRPQVIAQQAHVQRFLVLHRLQGPGGDPLLGWKQPRTPGVQAPPSFLQPQVEGERHARSEHGGGAAKNPGNPLAQCTHRQRPAPMPPDQGPEVLPMVHLVQGELLEQLLRRRVGGGLTLHPIGLGRPDGDCAIALKGCVEEPPLPGSIPGPPPIQ